MFGVLLAAVSTVWPCVSCPVCAVAVCSIWCVCIYRRFISGASQTCFFLKVLRVHHLLMASSFVYTVLIVLGLDHWHG